MASSPQASDRGVACAKFVVTGKVQGVFFRASTRIEAVRLGVRGHARNLADGSVEVVACASEAALSELAAWLQHGPPMARVEHVMQNTFDAGAITGDAFRVL